MEQKEKGGYYLGVATGLEAFDDLTSGLQAGDFIVLAARPSMGKTALALYMVQGMVMYGATPASSDKRRIVGFFSLEMSSEQLIARMLASLANVDGQSLNRGKLENFEWDAVYDAANRLSATKLFIDSSSNISMRTIRSRARRLQAEQGLDAVFIDYKVELMGRLTRDPEVKETASGKQMVRFTLAIDYGKDKAGNKLTNFVPCMAWQRRGENIAKYFSKGQRMIVTDGVLMVRNYTDENTQEKRNYTYVQVNDFEFVETKASVENMDSATLLNAAGLTALACRRCRFKRNLN